MNLSGLAVQLLNGLANASSLFLVAAGLSLIFGVTRIVNFAHGSLYMLGLYIAYSLINFFGVTVFGFWGGVMLAALAVAVIGVLIEVLLLRRIYHAPELFQLLATFALVLVIKDAALYLWGSEDLLGPRAPGLAGAVDIFGQRFPTYSLLLIAVGPIVLGLLWLLLTRTRWGTLIRAATQDREMVNALGVNQSWLFTSVFALGAFLAGLGGAIQIPNEPANLHLDLMTISDAFVIVVVGGMGSIPGAYLAALIIAETKAICAAIGTVDIFGISFAVSKMTLVAEFLIMAIVSLVNIAIHLAFPAHPVWSLPPVAIFAFGWALMVPAVTLLVLDLHPERRGMASSLQAVIGSTANGLVAGAIAPLVMHSAIALALTSALMLGIGLAAWSWLHRRWPDIGR